MIELIHIIYDYLTSDDGPDVELEDEELLEIAQGVAQAIIAAGWPRRA